MTLSLNWKGVGVASTKHTLIIKASPGGAALPVSERLIRSLPHPDKTASVWHVRFTPEGKLFTAGYPSGIVQLWDTANGKELRRIDSPRGYRNSNVYAQTPADYSTLYVPIENRTARRVEDDPKKRHRVEYKGEVLVWDLKTGKPMTPIHSAKREGVVDATISPDGKRLITLERGDYWAGEVSTSEIYRTRLYNLETGKVIDLGGHGMPAFTADSQRAVVALTSSASALKVFDRDGKEQATLALLEDGRSIYSPLLSPNEKLLAVTVGKGLRNEPGVLQLYDLATNKRVAEFATEGKYPFFAVAFSPDGKWLAASDFNNQVTIWDVAKRERWHRPVLKKGMATGLMLAFSPDSQTLVVPVRLESDFDRARDPDPLDVPQPRVLLFDVLKKSEPEEIVCPHGWTGGFAFSADGKTLAVGSAGAVHLFEVSKPRR